MFKYIKFTKVQTEYTVLKFREGDEAVKVNYFDKDIVSLEADNESDIDLLIISQDSSINCTEITKDEFKNIVIGTRQFKRIKEHVDARYSKEVEVLASQYPALERETWSTQLSQAKMFIASGTETDAPFLKILASAEEDTVANFANAVIAKAEQYEAFMAHTLADKRAFEKDLLMGIGL